MAPAAALAEAAAAGAPLTASDITAAVARIANEAAPGAIIHPGPPAPAAAPRYPRFERLEFGVETAAAVPPVLLGVDLARDPYDQTVYYAFDRARLATTYTRAAYPRNNDTTMFTVTDAAGNYTSRYVANNLMLETAYPGLQDTIYRHLETAVTNATLTTTNNIIIGTTTGANYMYPYAANDVYQWRYQPVWADNAGWADNPMPYAAPKQPIGVSKRAIARARKLIREHLSDEQLESLAKQDYFELESSSGKKYRIYRGHSMNVYRLDDAGKEVERLCAYSKTKNMPDEDHMLIQKLHLETDEDHYRKIANKVDLDTGQYHYAWGVAA